MTAFQVLLTKDHEINAIEQIVYLHEDVIEAMQEYAKSKCQEQKQICAENVQYVLYTTDIDQESIINSPSPKFD
jgi:hypothetical protein